MTTLLSPTAARQRWMNVLAQAPAAAVVAAMAAAWQTVAESTATRPRYDFLRPPEVGMALVRGRVGGDGAAFNMGEMTVTRCSVRLADGTIGHAWVAGRSVPHAEYAAVLDALLQDPVWHDRLETEVVARLEQAAEARHAATRAKAATTKVDFFTLVRGAD